jgi:hypothetical protein
MPLGETILITKFRKTFSSRVWVYGDNREGISRGRADKLTEQYDDNRDYSGSG